MSEKIQPTHLERRAVVYLRQSTLRQLHEHRESTARQYALKQRAIQLGFREESVDVIVVEYDRGEARIQQTTQLRREVEALLKKLGAPPPPKVHSVAEIPAPEAAA